MDLLIAKIDENGVITNGSALAVIDQSTAFSDVFIFSHGWWTTTNRAAAEYAQFDQGCGTSFASLRGKLPIPADDRLLPIGIEWPSMVVDTPGAFGDVFEAFSYPERRSVAELVAKTGVANLIRRIWRLASETRPLRIHVLGHSMGCRVVCQALETAILADSMPQDPNNPASAPWAKILPNIRLNVVLFAAATDNNSLERIQKYGILSAVADLRILVTRSDLDGVLASYPPDVDENPAMGAKGPTIATFTDPISHFHDQLGTASVDEGFDCLPVAQKPDTFVVADLTMLHKAHRAEEPSKWGGLSGNHSDIFCREIYDLTAAFLFPQY